MKEIGYCTTKKTLNYSNMIVSRNNKHRKLQQKHPKNKYFIIDNRFCHKKNNERKEKLNACSFSKN
jgi:Trm5-related predicted tRNA methylase